jgi:ribulose-5-phosphate 4-epimerase/fuculose-1-phosphate aldolase
MDDAMEKAAHMALTALCSQNMPPIAGKPISLYPIQDRSDLEWKARQDEARNIFPKHHHSGWAYMVSYAQHLFQLQHDTQLIVVGQRCRLGSYAKEVKSLNQEISRMAQEHGVVRQQVRDLESCLCDNDKKLLTIYRCLTERDQELLRHRGLLREAEEATAAKAHELEEF